MTRQHINTRPAPTGERAKRKQLRRSDAIDRSSREKRWTREVFKLNRIHGGKTLDIVEPVLREWHRDELPRLVPGLNKSFAETLARFRKGRKRVKHPWGEKMGPSVRRAKLAKYPLDVKRYDDDRRLQLLVKICRELQRDAGRGKTFFLTSRAAGHYAKVSPTTAADWLDTLAGDGVLTLVAKGSWKSRKGSTFRYRGRM